MDIVLGVYLIQRISMGHIALIALTIVLFVKQLVSARYVKMVISFDLKLMMIEQVTSFVLQSQSQIVLHTTMVSAFHAPMERILTGTNVPHVTIPVRRALPMQRLV